jgi:hypothetical protein
LPTDKKRIQIIKTKRRQITVDNGDEYFDYLSTGNEGYAIILLLTLKKLHHIAI